MSSRGVAAFRSIVRRHRTLVHLLVDGAAWLVGVTAAMLVRFDLTLDDWANWKAPVAMAVAAGLQLIAGVFYGLYRGRWRTGSFDEVAALALSATTVGATLTGLGLVFSPLRLVPTSVSLAAIPAALVAMSSARYVHRLFSDRFLRPAQPTERALVFGAGEGGAQALRVMLRNPQSPFLPVGLLDDDPHKSNLRLQGVPVVGTAADLGAVAARLDATTLVVAVPSAHSQLVRDLSEAALDHDISVCILPKVAEIFDGRVDLADIRPLTEADLLGRNQIDTDIDAIAGYLTGKRVLVTGAGGSIGSELCHQIHRFAPAKLIMLDRDESALHATQLSIYGRALLETRDLVVANLRDRDRVMRVFAEHEPEVVFHAAALKHLPLLEMYPDEGLKTNVWGSHNTLLAARAHGVERFVNVSTDKAADPSSVLGYTKRLAERLTAAVAAEGEGTYLSVRFGNVLGSRGSMLGAFERQVAAGGPITVTHPDVTRFFMTVQEASQLVIQAGAVGRDGEALVLDMGEPVKILDVARRLVAQADRPIDIVFTGLRPGEKLHEVLLGDGESDERPAHPLISHVTAPPIDVNRLTHLDEIVDREALVAELARLGSRSGHDVGIAVD